MENRFFTHPILNSPYEEPVEHWELDNQGQPTQKTVKRRRDANFITPIPKPRKQKTGKKKAGKADAEGGPAQDPTHKKMRGAKVAKGQRALTDDKGWIKDGQEYDPTPLVNALRREIEYWRAIPDPGAWMVTPETARLLQHWRHHEFAGIRPFFCQVEAVETAIWLTEVAPKMGKKGQYYLEHLKDACEEANPGLNRLALKLATGAGKTTVMAMLIAWQTINKARHPNARRFTKGFLVVAPGITIKDRLRVLQPNDPDSYYRSRELVPPDMMAELGQARITITNFHAFKLREKLDVSKGGRRLLQGRGEELKTLETEGEMIRRALGELKSMKNIMVFNDEAHHCYREKPGAREVEELKGEEKKEAGKNNEAARLWISGLEAVNRNLGVLRVMDLSATPFFLRGSGYAEGTLFPWTMSDFSLMDAIECGIVKLPRVPVADNIPGEDAPKFRNLWQHIAKKMPKKGRGKAGGLDPLSLPVELQTALEALYGHYAKTFDLWRQEGISTPPCFIVVCNNTATSKLVYDYISGFEQINEDGTSRIQNGRLELFRNFDQNDRPLARPNTLLIDSEQLESGDALDVNFRKMSADALEKFRREIIERTGDPRQADHISDQELLREVMNTVGKTGSLGESIRCVVSVSMLTEGWDANTVTHVLGVRAFGTQLLCEQVVGRALRRQSYDLNAEGLFDVEYADVLGIPFDFTAAPVAAPPQKPRETVMVKAVRPERDHLEIRFPRVTGYRVDLSEKSVSAEFTEDSTLILSPDLVGPSVTRNAGIIGENVDLDLKHLDDIRRSSLIFHLTTRLLYTKFREAGEDPQMHLFGKLKRVVSRWLKDHLVCKGGAYPAQLMYQELADMACERMVKAITRAERKHNPVKAVLDIYNPEGSTSHVQFSTSKPNRWETDSRYSHINYVVLDSDWEAEFCRVAEGHEKVRAYVKNHSLGFEIPYVMGNRHRNYRPDFIVLVDDGKEDLLHLIVEIKGFRGEDAKIKKETAEEFWVPAVNRQGGFGRWAFVEMTDVYDIASDFEAVFDRMIREASAPEFSA